MSSTPAARTDRPRRSLLYPFAESAAMAGVLALANLFLRPEDPGLVSFAPHPILFAGLLIAARYGLVASLIGTVVLSIEHGAMLLLLAEVPTWHHYLDAPYSTPLALLLPTMVVVGTLVDRHIARLYGAIAGGLSEERELARVRAEAAQLREVNVALGSKVVGADVTFSALHRASKAMNSLLVGDIYAGIARVLTEVVRAEAVSIWVVDGPGALRLVHATGVREGADEAPPIGAQIEAYFDERGVLAIHDLPESFRDARLPYILGRVTEGRGGKLVAYVAVERLPFSRYSAETLRLFSVLVEWASESIDRARFAWDRGHPEADTIRPTDRDLVAVRRALGTAPLSSIGSASPSANPEGPRRGELVRLFASVDAALGSGQRTRRASGIDIEAPVEASAEASEHSGDADESEGSFASSPLGNLLVGINEYLSGDKKRRRS